MCGIAGLWGKADSAARDAVARMVAALHHRGPDDRGVQECPDAVLGMTRLAVIDLSPAAHQPMATPNGRIWIVYNGEMYNFQEERRVLEGKGFVFRSQSDTEVVLRMYEHYGDDFLKRLRGMFALAIHDARQGPGQERLLLARDPFGIKPMLYCVQGKELLFASEMKALLASGRVPPEINPVGLRLLLTFGSVYQPHTILKGVEMLPPAHRLIAEKGRIRTERYWPFSTRAASQGELDYEEAVEQVASALQDSVQRHLVSDVPVGAFLSGGVDSTYLVGLMARQAQGRVKTFSVGSNHGDPHLDETDEAQAQADLLGTDHTRVLIRGEDVRDRLAHAVWALDQPSVDGFNSYFVSWAARQAVTVAISGTGGDELFAGYPWFTNMARYEAEAAHPSLRARARGLWRCLRGGARTDDGGFLAAYANQYHIQNAAGVASLLSGDLRSVAEAGRSMSADLESYDELARGDSVQRVSALCLRSYTCCQLLRDMDAVSMAHSLEIRVPFLDLRLLELALSLPVAYKLQRPLGGEAAHEATYRALGAKRILIEAGQRCGVLSARIDLQQKRGFTLPFAPWLRGAMRESLEDTLSERSVRARGFLDSQAVAKVLEAFRQGACDWPRPWLLMILELWCRTFLTGSSSARGGAFAANTVAEA